MSSRTADRPIAVRLHSVNKSFGPVKALKETSFEIRQGELMTLLGPSGCGKTTLLNIIAGFLAADEGSLEIAGERVNDVPAFRREIGMVFQNYALFPHMTVAANVGYGLKMRSLPKAEIAKRVGEALALIKLSGFEERRPRQLSGGQQQRVALARALVIRPKILLLDEPFSALDKSLRASMQVEVKDIQRKLGLTTIFVTHDQSEALSLSDRLAVMSEGQIRQAGTPEDVYAKPADRFVASFIGDVNVIPAHIESLNDHYAQVTFGDARILVPRQHLGGAEPGNAVELFVRPEQLRLVEAGEEPALRGLVHTKIYQGGYTDVLVDVPGLLQDPVRIRVGAQVTPGSWFPGMPAGIAFASEKAIAFPKAS
jgi:spermidine/putrescine ABC transporter ATP-binding subunit